ncbi:cell envelope biogenesis protein OmpA [Formosa maritima]|uniref:Cell envelope biogenesis protein OmpA n=1 Tax=Formosa maritima TaxID=2592046 RepID=A0A5D0G466_9FLAO|nr:cell envelope biogenesis protein OmpA [Formosa maritima]TYA53069.1 cell envelope biogenesis protein OmpA [Formosa maritima]
MNAYYINFKQASVSIIFLLITFLGFGQAETSKWKVQFAVGINSPSSSGFVTGFEANSINFPTINLGVQHMFKRQFGAKLDFGYNRFSNVDSSPNFKVNYTRINAQFIYDPTPVITFLPVGMGVVAHAGPGLSIIKPLDIYTDNNTSFLNIMAGIEFHYSITQLLTIYLDTSYIYGFSSDFDPVSEGYGSFNGNLLTATIGVSYSLSGCYYCD